MIMMEDYICYYCKLPDRLYSILSSLLQLYTYVYFLAGRGQRLCRATLSSPRGCLLFYGPLPTWMKKVLKETKAHARVCMLLEEVSPFTEGHFNTESKHRKP